MPSIWKQTEYKSWHDEVGTLFCLTYLWQKNISYTLVAMLDFSLMIGLIDWLIDCDWRMIEWPIIDWWLIYCFIDNVFTANLLNDWLMIDIN